MSYVWEKLDNDRASAASNAARLAAQTGRISYAECDRITRLAQDPRSNTVKLMDARNRLWAMDDRK